MATNVVASRPPERQPTAMPTACAKIGCTVYISSSMANLICESKFLYFEDKQAENCWPEAGWNNNRKSLQEICVGQHPGQEMLGTYG